MSFTKETIIKIINSPIGNAAIILTDCRLYKVFSEKIRLIGSMINNNAQMVRMILLGSSSGEIYL